MRLVNYGTGEICDRLSILGLKILHTERAGHDVTHFQKERAALIAKLTSRKGSIQGDVWSGLWELAAVNGALWFAEDELRVLRHEPVAQPKRPTPTITLVRVSEVAIRIQSLNDRRAEVITTINRATGEHHGSEKSLALTLPECQPQESAPVPSTADTLR